MTQNSFSGSPLVLVGYGHEPRDDAASLAFIKRGAQRFVTSDEGFAVFQSIQAEIFSEINSHDERDALELFDAITKICVRSHQDELQATESNFPPSPTHKSLCANGCTLVQQEDKELCREESQASELTASIEINSQHTINTQATKFLHHLDQNGIAADAELPEPVPDELPAAVISLKSQADEAMEVQVLTEQLSHPQNSSTVDMLGKSMLMNHTAQGSPRKSIVRRPPSSHTNAGDTQDIQRPNIPSCIVSSLQEHHEKVYITSPCDGLCDKAYAGETAQIYLPTHLTQSARQYPELDPEARQSNLELQRLVPTDCARRASSARHELTVTTTGFLSVPEHEHEARDSPWILPVLPDFEPLEL